MKNTFLQELFRKNPSCQSSAIGKPWLCYFMASSLEDCSKEILVKENKNTSSPVLQGMLEHRTLLIAKVSHSVWEGKSLVKY